MLCYLFSFVAIFLLLATANGQLTSFSLSVKNQNGVLVPLTTPFNPTTDITPGTVYNYNVPVPIGTLPCNLLVSGQYTSYYINNVPAYSSLDQGYATWSVPVAGGANSAQLTGTPTDANAGNSCFSAYGLYCTLTIRYTNPGQPTLGAVTYNFNINPQMPALSALTIMALGGNSDLKSPSAVSSNNYVQYTATLPVNVATAIYTLSSLSPFQTNIRYTDSNTGLYTTLPITNGVSNQISPLFSAANAGTAVVNIDSYGVCPTYTINVTYTSKLSFIPLVQLSSLLVQVNNAFLTVTPAFNPSVYSYTVPFPLQASTLNPPVPITITGGLANNLLEYNVQNQAYVSSGSTQAIVAFNGQTQVNLPINVQATSLGTIQPYSLTLVASNMCIPGYFSATNGNLPCTPCPAGTYSAGLGATQCTACAINRYTSSSGSYVCSLCPANYHTISAQSTSCVPCPPGETSNSGSACVNPNGGLGGGGTKGGCKGTTCMLNPSDPTGSDPANDSGASDWVNDWRIWTGIGIGIVVLAVIIGGGVFLYRRRLGNKSSLNAGTSGVMYRDSVIPHVAQPSPLVAAGAITSV